MTAPTCKHLIVTALAVLLAIGAGLATYLALTAPATTPSGAATPGEYMPANKQIANWIQAH